MCVGDARVQLCDGGGSLKRPTPSQVTGHPDTVATRCVGVGEGDTVSSLIKTHTTGNTHTTPIFRYYVRVIYACGLWGRGN